MSFTAEIWCELDDPADDPRFTEDYEHPDEAADAAYDLMQAQRRLGREVHLYGWTLIDGEDPGETLDRFWKPRA